MHSIPTIDLSNLDTEKALKDIAGQLREIYSTIGFATITGHGVPSELIEKMFASSKQFHELPLTEKMAIRAEDSFSGYHPAASYALRNTGIKESTTTPNLNESLGVMPELGAEARQLLQGTSLGAPNQWPEALPGLKLVALEYINEMTKLSKRLLQAFALCLGCDKNALNQFLQPEPVVNLRMLHYMELPDDAQPNLYGIAPHSDYGLFTLVCQGSISGLQVRAPDSLDWLDVPVVDNSFVLNTADILTRLSNGLLLSTPHRVINQPKQERYSHAFFLSPCFDETIEPLGQCIEQTGGSAQFSAITYRDYIAQKYADNYGD